MLIYSNIFQFTDEEIGTFIPTWHSEKATSIYSLFGVEEKWDVLRFALKSAFH